MDSKDLQLVIVDFSESDNGISAIKDDMTSNGKSTEFIMKKEEFMSIFKMSIDDVIKQSFNLFNIKNNLEISEHEIEEITKEFKDYLHKIRCEEISEEKPGVFFADIYDNKICKFIKNNNLKLFFKLHILNKYTFINIQNCIFKGIIENNNKEKKELILVIFIRI